MDPTVQDDFPKAPISAPFLQLETSLTCPICTGLLDTPLLLKNCGHSFCSRCIRPNLEFQERKGIGNVHCPSCRKSCDARDLQVNLSLGDAAMKYQEARTLLSQLLWESLERQRHGEREAEAVRTGHAGKGTKNAAPTLASQKKRAKQQQQQQQQQPATNGRKLRPRHQQHQPSSSDAPLRSGACARAQGTSVGKQAQQERARKRQRNCDDDSRAGMESDEGWEEEEEEEVSSGSEFVVEVDSGSEGEGGRSQVDGSGTIDLVDSDLEGGSAGSLSDAERLSPPAKRTRQAQLGRRRRGSAAAAARQDSTPHQQQPQRTARKQQQPPESPSGEAGEGHAAGGSAAGPPDMPKGYVSCPICSKLVPQFYINSHVDTCLKGVSAGATSGRHKQQQQQQQASQQQNHQNQQDTAGPSSSASQQAQQQTTAAAAVQQPFEPLQVPPKLVPELSSEKALRGFLTKYGLPPEGKKKEMLERYNAMRLAVQTTNDKQERASYKELARRIMREERQRAIAGAAVAGGLLGRKQQQPAATAVLRSSQPQPAATSHSVGAAVGEAGIISTGGHTYKALIAAIRARKAAKKAAAEAAAARAAAEPAVAPAAAAGGVDTDGPTFEVEQQQQQQQRQTAEFSEKEQQVAEPPKVEEEEEQENQAIETSERKQRTAEPSEEDEEEQEFEGEVPGAAVLATSSLEAAASAAPLVEQPPGAPTAAERQAHPARDGGQLPGCTLPAPQELLGQQALHGGVRPALPSALSLLRPPSKAAAQGAASSVSPVSQQQEQEQQQWREDHAKEQLPPNSCVAPSQQAEPHSQGACRAEALPLLAGQQHMLMAHQGLGRAPGGHTPQQDMLAEYVDCLVVADSDGESW